MGKDTCALKEEGVRTQESRRAERERAREGFPDLFPSPGVDAVGVSTLGNRVIR